MPLPPNRGSLIQLGLVALPIYRPAGVKTGHEAPALNSYGLKLAVSCLPWLMMLAFCKTKMTTVGIKFSLCREAVSAGRGGHNGEVRMKERE